MMMRDAFHEELDQISQSLLNMASLVNLAMEDATQALLTPDLGIAEKVDRKSTRLNSSHT